MSVNQPPAFNERKTTATHFSDTIKALRFYQNRETLKVEKKLEVEHHQEIPDWPASAGIWLPFKCGLGTSDGHSHAFRKPVFSR